MNKNVAEYVLDMGLIIKVYFYYGLCLKIKVFFFKFWRGSNVQTWKCHKLIASYAQSLDSIRFLLYKFFGGGDYLSFSEQTKWQDLRNGERNKAVLENPGKFPRNDECRA